MHTFSAVEIINKIKLKELSVTEITNIFINRIKEVNPYINAITQFDTNRILHEALIADKFTSTSQTLPLLHGLPITIKDAFHVKNFIISKGCPALKQTSQYDATVVARLKNAGAIIFGITNTPELLLSYETDNLLYGRTNNPYDLNKTPGGSSGGQAAIISAGGTPVGIGSDAGGSLRQPAHYCGICAHKPTHRAVPLTGIFPSENIGLGTQLLSIGPMARHVEDLILLMRIISGPDQEDPYVSPISFGNPNCVNLKLLRVAYFFENPTGNNPSDDTVKAINNILFLLKPEVQSITHSFPEILRKAYRLHLETFMYGGDGGESLRKFLKKIGQKEISKLTQDFLSRAAECQFSITELKERLAEVDMLKYNMMKFMKNFDVIISPVTATPAPVHGKSSILIRDFGYVIVHNLTGWPATVIPCGYAKNGLPIGIQIAAKPWMDHICLALALKIQKILGVFPIPDIQKIIVKN